MLKKEKVFVPVLLLALMFCLFFKPAGVSAASNSYADFQTRTLKAGMSGSDVSFLQDDLKNLGVFNTEPTGFYGEITASSVRQLQAKYGLVQDGVTGRATYSLINRIFERSQAAALSSRGSSDSNYSYLMPWFGGVQNFFNVGDTAVVYDIATGLSFNIRRSYGYNHADCETLTASDTAVMKNIFGGSWSWERRAVIVNVNGRKIAASMAGMPHAGVDSKPADAYVSGRSDGYGAGTNLDAVKGNNMDGHFDLHFLGSKTHGTNMVDKAHQSMVQKAAEWAARNN